MAINFSQVKAITIPEGSVKKITDSTGNILWKEKTAEWHTIWEGDKTITANKNSISGTLNNFCQTAENTGNSPQIRITYTRLYGMADSPSVIKYFNNSTSDSPNTSSKPESPVTITLNSADTVYVLGVYSQTTYVGVDMVYLVKTNNGTSRCYLSLKGNYIANPSNTAELTITKIEQYY